MKLSKVKETFNTKIVIAGELKSPTNLILANLCHEALLYVATRCTPLVLLREKVDETETVFRLITGAKSIIDPGTPDFESETEHLMIDEDLSYAVINKMCALYSREAKNIVKFENEVKTIVNDFKANFLRIGDGT